MKYMVLAVSIVMVLALIAISYRIASYSSVAGLISLAAEQDDSSDKVPPGTKEHYLSNGKFEKWVDRQGTLLPKSWTTVERADSVVFQKQAEKTGGYSFKAFFPKCKGECKPSRGFGITSDKFKLQDLGIVADEDKPIYLSVQTYQSPDDDSTAEFAMRKCYETYCSTMCWFFANDRNTDKWVTKTKKCSVIDDDDLTAEYEIGFGSNSGHSADDRKVFLKVDNIKLLQ